MFCVQHFSKDTTVCGESDSLQLYDIQWLSKNGPRINEVKDSTSLFVNLTDVSHTCYLASVKRNVVSAFR